jgi:hypothetical protein
MAFISLMERHKSPLHSLLLGAAFAAAASFAGANPAMALDAKQCLPMAEMNAALKAEGQRTLIIGDRIASVGREGTTETRMVRAVNTVTSNADGSLGYQLEGNLPRTEASTRVCVRAKLTDIQLFDARKDGIPQAVFLGGKFDLAVKEKAAKGTRPMLMANTVFGSGASERKGLPLLVFGNFTKEAGSIETRDLSGTAQILAVMSKTDYTAIALEILYSRNSPAPKP